MLFEILELPILIFGKLDAFLLDKKTNASWESILSEK